ncbi:peptidylprolyl isomerase [Bacteroidia bacterium]|nr:peptidylprolyl isomerase [Bacteroidia bacterium]
MATLEKIRNNARWLLVGFVGLALFAFIFDGFFRSGSTFFNKKKEKVVIVNGESIGIRDFQAKIEETTNNYKNRTRSAISEDDQIQIRQSVFDEMIGNLLLDAEAEKVGFAVGKEELTDLIMGNNISPMLLQIPDFQNQETKQFDKNILLSFLQTIEADPSAYTPEIQQQIFSMKNSWLSIEDAIVVQKKLAKLSNLIASGVAANALDAKAAYDENEVSVDFEYVSQSYNSIPDSAVSVSDAEIAALYELRKGNFKQETAKVIDFISVAIVPSEADIDEIVKRLEGVKNELTNTTEVIDIINEHSDVPFLDAYVSINVLDANAKNFVEKSQVGDIEGPVEAQNFTYNVYKLIDIKEGPDSIKVNQMTLPAISNEAQLNHLADSLINVIKSGKTFADMVKESGGQGDGDMGWQTETSLVRGVDAKFMNALFDAKLNDVFVTKSPYGSHIVQVIEKTSPVKKYKVGTVQVTVTPGTETNKKIYSDLNQYVSKNSNVESFKTAAAEAGYVCQTNVQVTENQPSLAPIRNSRQAIRWAFDHKKGEVSDIFECQDYFVVVAVEGAIKEGYRSLADLSDYLKRELINEKKGRKIVETLKGKNLSSLENYAEAMNSTVQEVKFVTFSTQRISGIGADAVVNYKATVAEPGQTTEPFAGKNAVYVLKVTDKKNGGTTYDEKEQKTKLNSQNSYRLMSTVQSGSLLKENAKIEDNRIRFY